MWETRQAGLTNFSTYTSSTLTNCCVLWWQRRVQIGWSPCANTTCEHICDQGTTCPLAPAHISCPSGETKREDDRIRSCIERSVFLPKLLKQVKIYKIIVKLFSFNLNSLFNIYFLNIIHYSHKILIKVGKQLFYFPLWALVPLVVLCLSLCVNQLNFLFCFQAFSVGLFWLDPTTLSSIAQVI